MIARVSAVRGRAAVVAVVGSALIAVAGGCAAHPGDGPARGPGGDGTGTTGARTPSTVPGRPLAGADLYVEPGTPAAQEVDRLGGSGRADDARQLGKVTTRPVAHWLTDEDPARIRTEVQDVVGRATGAGKMPVLVAYHIPNRDCGSYSAGGATGADQYREWAGGVAAGIGGRPATIILEPDAVAHTLDTCRADRQQRYALLSDVVAVLKAGGGTRVYLDAGNPGWIRDVGALADALRQAGVRSADGFALNVANFVTTPENVSYGTRLSDALGGAHFVIDTSRNGNGPWNGDAAVNAGPTWCNPPGRALGAAPTTRTGLPRVDALLWVKRPGDSDGACRPGEPPAGQWWPEYALDLARRSP
jgi:endoglucanase